jgi:hypothetical protein
LLIVVAGHVFMAGRRILAMHHMGARLLVADDAALAANEPCVARLVTGGRTGGRTNGLRRPGSTTGSCRRVSAVFRVGPALAAGR